MQPFTIPLILVALGGAGLVVLRDNRATLVALFAQWLGLGWAALELNRAAGGSGLGREGSAELVTAGACAAIFVLTLRSIGETRSSDERQPLTDYLLPAASALLAGVAGLGFANLFPLLGETRGDLVFYWAALSGTLALILDGSRSPVKLAAGLLALLNATALLVYALNPAATGTALLGMLASARIALAVLMAYGWALLRMVYGALSLDPLFGTRDTDEARPLVMLDAPDRITEQGELPPPRPDTSEVDEHEGGEVSDDTPAPAQPQTNGPGPSPETSQATVTERAREKTPSP